jgi:hypothetical protein
MNRTAHSPFSQQTVVSLMNRRAVRGLGALACIVAISAATVVIVDTSARGNDRADTAGTNGKGLPPVEVVKYWSDSKTALSPLLLYVRQLPVAIKAVQDANGAASDSQLRQAKVMAESFATARDLVGRIAVPANAPTGVGELLQVACQLYRQSALTLPELKTTTNAPARLAIAGRAAALQTLGDRLFDQARRVLDIDAVGRNQAPVEYQYAPPVPTVADLTGTPMSAPAGSSNLEEILGSARLLIARVSTGMPDTAATTLPRLRGMAAAMESDTTQQGEDVIAARLSIALALVAEQAKAAGQPKSAGPLLMLSNDVWNTSRTLSSRPNQALQIVGAPRPTRSEVWTGGQFHGRPPALKPGQDVGSGLPGGLPEIDPTQILKG